MLYSAHLCRIYIDMYRPWRPPEAGRRKPSKFCWRH
jgi:hypothetical protein